MTLEATESTVRYVGNGATTEFGFPFRVWSADQVAVYVGDGEQEAEVSSSCTTAVTDTGGTVTFAEAPAEGTAIVIQRSMPYTQEDNYENGGRFNGEEVEDRFDMDAAERQDLKRDLGRAVKTPVTSTLSGDELVSDLYQARQDAVDAVETIGGAEEVMAARDAVLEAFEAAGEVAGATRIASAGEDTLRSLSERFADFINVRDYGAKGDGETDDTEAIQAALDADMHGGVWFPHGVYVITEPIIIKNDTRKYYGPNGEYYVSCNPTIDLDGSAIVWGGSNGADNMIILSAQTATLRNGKIWGAPLNDPADTHVVKNPVKITNEYGSCFNARVSNLVIAGYSEAGIRIGDEDHMSSYGVMIDHVYVTANNSISNWEGSGPTGIDVWGADCKFSNVITQRNKRHFWLHTSGHQIVNCHMVSTTKDQSANHAMPETAAIWYSLVNASSWYQNVVSNCYFDNVKYVIYNESSHRAVTQISNSFYFNSGTVFDRAYAPGEAYLLGGPTNSGSPVAVSNFVVQPSYFVRFFSGVECGQNYAMLCKEDYCQDLNAYVTTACPWLAKFKVQSGRPTRVLDGDLENNKTYCIGGVLARSLAEVKFRVCITSTTHAEIDVEFKNIGGSNSNWVSKVYNSWGSSTKFLLEIHTPITVNIRGTDLYFVPLCVKNTYGSTWSGNCQARMFSNSPSIGLYLVHVGTARVELSALYSDSGISIPETVVSSASMEGNLYGGVPLLPNETTASTTASLNDIRTSGTYPINCDSNTTGKPFTGYGLLEVFTVSSRGGVTSYPITLQRATQLTGSRNVYQRSISGSEGGTISEWSLLNGS